MKANLFDSTHNPPDILQLAKYRNLHFSRDIKHFLLYIQNICMSSLFCWSSPHNFMHSRQFQFNGSIRNKIQILRLAFNGAMFYRRIHFQQRSMMILNECPVIFEFSHLPSQRVIVRLDGRTLPRTKKCCLTYT